MEAKQAQIQELKAMLDSGLVNDEQIIKETKATIQELEAEIAAAQEPEQTLLTAADSRPKAVNKSSKKAKADQEVPTIEGSLSDWYAQVYPGEPVLKEVEVKKMGEDGEIEQVETYLNVSARQAIVTSAMHDARLTGFKEAGIVYEWAEKVKKGKGGKNLVLGDFIVSTSDQAAKSKKAAKPKALYSWKEATPLSEMQPIVLHCQHYHIEVKEETPVSIKGAGNRSNSISAKPGEHLIFDDSGKLVFIMDAASFARKCNEPVTVEQHIETKHQAEQAALPAEKAKEEPAAKSSPERKSPYTVLEAEIKDVVKIMKKPRMSKEDADRLPAELKDIDIRARSTARKSTLDYIEKQAQKIAEGDKLSKSEVIKLALAAQPMVRSGRSVVLDMLFTNRKRLEPTVDGLLRWLKNPSDYDLIGVDVQAGAAATVKPRRPKEDLLTILKMK